MNIQDGERFTLGSDKAKKLLKSVNNTRLYDAVELINSYGSQNSHTEYTKQSTNEMLREVINALFYLYSFLLIDFFEKYEFGKNTEIIKTFSILPPIIRYITLESLYEKYSDNIHIIDRLALATVKAFDEAKAQKWVEDNKYVFENLSSMSDEAAQNMIEQYGVEFASVIISDAPNMYDLCRDKIRLIDEEIKKRGKMYDDFESALPHYNENGTINGDSPEIIQFNAIMEFLYLGRKVRE